VPDRQPAGPPPATGLRFGRSVASPGDLNGDSQPDYVIGAPHVDVGANSDQGRVYVFLSQGPSGTPTPTPTVTATPTATATVTPTATVPPGYDIDRQRPGLSGKVRPKRDRRKPYQFTATGELKLPGGVSEDDGCEGQVSVKIARVRKGRDKTVSARRATVRSNCRYTHKRTFGRKRLKRKRGTLRFVIRFQGNDVLKPRRIVRKAKFGRG